MKTDQQNFLDRLRQKPDSYRRNFSIIVSALITLIILAAWSVSLSATLRSDESAKQLSASSSFFSFSSIKDQLTSLFSRPDPSYATSSSDLQAGGGIKAEVQ